METPKSEMRRAILNRVAPAFAIIGLSATVGISLAQFLNGRPSLFNLAYSFMPSVVVASILLAVFLSKKSSVSFTFPSSLPRVGHRLAILFALMFLGLVFLVGLVSVVAVNTWGLTLAILIMVAYASLFAVFWTSIFSVVNAVALYFAIWPVLTVIKVSIMLRHEPGLYQSLFIVPLRVQSETLVNSLHPVADTFLGQLAVLSPEVLFIFALFIGWVIGRMRGVASGSIRTPIDLAVAVLLGAGIVSALLSSAPVFSMVWLLGELVAPILLCYVLASSLRVRRDIYVVLSGMLTGLAIIAAYQALETYRFLMIEGEATRFGVLGNANFSAAIMVYLLPVSLVFIFSARAGRLRRVIAAFILILTVAAVILSGSRGPWIAMLFIVASLIWVMPRVRIQIMLAVVFLFLAALPLMQNLSAIIVDIRPDLTSVEEAVTSKPRIFLWQASVEVLASPLIYGIGPGMFPTLGIGDPTRSAVFEHAHQDFLNIGIETGLVGMAAFVAIVLLTAKHTLLRIRALTEDYFRQTVKWVAISLLGFLIIAVTTGVPFHGTQGIMGGLIPWAMVAIIIGAGRVSR